MLSMLRKVGQTVFQDGVQLESDSPRVVFIFLAAGEIGLGMLKSMHVGFQGHGVQARHAGLKARQVNNWFLPRLRAFGSLVNGKERQLTPKTVALLSGTLGPWSQRQRSKRRSTKL